MKQCNNKQMLLSFTHKYFPYTITYMIVLLEYHSITSRAVHVKLAIGINTKVVDVWHYMKNISRGTTVVMFQCHNISSCLPFTEFTTGEQSNFVQYCS